jgi:acyl-CoA thioesterase
MAPVGAQVGGPCSADDHYAALLGIVPLSASAGSARAELVVQERHLNDIGRIHGGALFSLADAAVALAANATDAERAVVTMGEIQFLRPAVSGERLVATAVREFRIRRRAGYRVRITSGQELVALATGETLVISP